MEGRIWIRRRHVVRRRVRIVGGRGGAPRAGGGGADQKESEARGVGGAEEVGGRSSTEEMLWISLHTELAQGGGTRGVTSSAGPGLEKMGIQSWMLYSLVAPPPAHELRAG